MIDLAVAGRMLAACLVIALVLAALKYGATLAVRRRTAFGARGGRLVSVLETTLLPGAASLHVVRIADRYVVVGRSAGHIAALCDVPPESVAAWRGPAARAAPPEARCAS